MYFFIRTLALIKIIKIIFHIRYFQNLWYFTQMLDPSICYAFLPQIKIWSKGSVRVTQIKKVECIGERKARWSRHGRSISAPPNFSFSSGDPSILLNLFALRDCTHIQVCFFHYADFYYAESHCLYVILSTTRNIKYSME